MYFDLIISQGVRDGSRGDDGASQPLGLSLNDLSGGQRVPPILPQWAGSHAPAPDLADLAALLDVVEHDATCDGASACELLRYRQFRLLAAIQAAGPPFRGVAVIGDGATAAVSSVTRPLPTLRLCVR